MDHSSPATPRRDTPVPPAPPAHRPANDPSPAPDLDFPEPDLEFPEPDLDFPPPDIDDELSGCPVFNALCEARAAESIEHQEAQRLLWELSWTPADAVSPEAA